MNKVKKTAGMAILMIAVAAWFLRYKGGVKNG